MDPTFQIEMPAVILNAKQFSGSVNLPSTYSHLPPFLLLITGWQDKKHTMVELQCAALLGCPFSEIKAILRLLWVIIPPPSSRSSGGLEVTFPWWHNSFSPEKDPPCSPLPSFQPSGTRKLAEYFKTRLKFRNTNAGQKSRKAAECLAKRNYSSLILLH